MLMANVPHDIPTLTRRWGSNRLTNHTHTRISKVAARSTAAATQHKSFHTLPDGMRLEVCTTVPIGRQPGTVQGTPIILVHGSYHAAWCWQQGFASRLADSGGHTCHAISLRGQGASDKDGLQTHAEDLVHFIRTVTDASGPAVVVAHSLGGAVVQRLMQDAGCTASLRGVVLLASMPPAGATLMVGRMLAASPSVTAQVTWSFISRNFMTDMRAFQRPVPMVNLRAAREEFPLRPKATMPIMVAGALQDTIVDVQAVKETAEALGTQAMLYNMAHDMMLYAQKEHHLTEGGALAWSNIERDAPNLTAIKHAAPRPSLKQAATSQAPATTATHAPTDVEYDAVVIGSGMGGLTAATQLASKGMQNVLVLEKYIIPGGSAGAYSREGYVFDVGSSMMFGFGEQGTTNLITRALAAAGQRLETVPDPTQIHYHLPQSNSHPQGLEVKVWRDYEQFVAELTARFPHEATGIRGFYGECWRVFNALNSLELLSLEEPRYLLQQFARNPLACLTLASFVTTNTGDVARRYIKDQELLRFIDIECYCWSTVLADLTPMINAGMVFCDRHFGGINYPKGGVGRIAEAMAQGLQELGGRIEYKANVTAITTDPESGRATGVRLADGREYRARVVVSNATRWDTFERLLGCAPAPQSPPAASPRDKRPSQPLPEGEALFRGRYQPSPSFISIHMGVRADLIPPGTECHHIIVEDWEAMEQPRGTLFVSIPTLLDPTLAPPGTHIIHYFTPDWIEDWQNMPAEAYEAKKTAVADDLVERLEAAVFPGLRDAVLFREVGTPRTHRRFLNRVDGSYGPIPSRTPLGMMGMPFNTTEVQDLYCVGDSTFPGQGVNAVVFSGFGCAHRILCDVGKQPTIPVLDGAFQALLRTVRNAA